LTLDLIENIMQNESLWPKRWQLISGQRLRTGILPFVNEASSRARN